MMLRKVIFWFDLVYIFGVLVLYTTLSDTRSASLGNVLVGGVMPILVALNVGISASVYRENGRRK